LNLILTNGQEACLSQNSAFRLYAVIFFASFFMSATRKVNRSQAWWLESSRVCLSHHARPTQNTSSSAVMNWRCYSLWCTADCACYTDTIHCRACRQIFTVRHKKNTPTFFCHNFYNTWPIL